MDYRRECQQDDIVDSLTSLEADEDTALTKSIGTNGHAAATEATDDSLNFLHFLRVSGQGLEINRGRTEWRKKSEKI